MYFSSICDGLAPKASVQTCDVANEQTTGREVRPDRGRREGERRRHRVALPGPPPAGRGDGLAGRGFFLGRDHEGLPGSDGRDTGPGGHGERSRLQYSS